MGTINITYGIGITERVSRREKDMKYNTKQTNKTMRTPCMISNEEAANRLYKESEAIFRQFNQMYFEEQQKALSAQNKGNEEEYLRHVFRQRLIDMCMTYITRTPEEFLKLTTKYKQI